MVAGQSFAGDFAAASRRVSAVRNEYRTDENGDRLTDESGNRLVVEVSPDEVLRQEILRDLELVDRSVAGLKALAVVPVRGHNNPPELILPDGDPIMRRLDELTDIVQALRDEMKKPSPDRTVAKGWSTKMIAAGLTIVSFVGGIASGLVESAVWDGLKGDTVALERVQTAIGQASERVDEWYHLPEH